jgi:low affinity Fe/Cu permease
MASSSSAQRKRNVVTPPRETISDRFRRLADRVTEAAGSAWAMGGAALVIVVWPLTGPIFGFSDTWQLIINTGTTIVTFLMVFAIQTSQNRESKAMHLKLDELIRATKGARNAFIDEEYETEAELKLDEARLRQRARRTRR